jgi:hypothetical protein
MLLTDVRRLLMSSRQGLGDGRHSDAIGFFARTARPTRRPIRLRRPEAKYDMHLVELTLSGEPAQFTYGPAEYHT